MESKPCDKCAACMGFPGYGNECDWWYLQKNKCPKLAKVSINKG